MTLRLRTDDLPDDALVLVHLGAGAVCHVLDAALRNYPAYRHLTPDRSGCFTVSVFAVTDELDVATIVTSLHRRQYGLATAGAVRAHFPLLATSDDNPRLDEPIARLQSVHHDVLLPHPDEVRLADVDPDGDPELRAACLRHLVPYADVVLDLFSPRRRYDLGEGAC